MPPGCDENRVKGGRQPERGQATSVTEPNARRGPAAGREGTSRAGRASPPGVRERKKRLTMTTPVSLLASMTVTRQVAGRTAARMSSASACPLTVDTGTKVTAEGGSASTNVNPAGAPCRRFT